MQIPLLTPQKDPMGAAIADYFANGKASKLRVFSSMFDEDEIPVKQLFRNFTEMPALEQEALRMSEGRILDVGAGSGCHSLALQEMGKAKGIVIDGKSHRHLTFVCRGHAEKRRKGCLPGKFLQRTVQRQLRYDPDADERFGDCRKDSQSPDFLPYFKTPACPGRLCMDGLFRPPLPV